jgi:hypothetical protein
MRGQKERIQSARYEGAPTLTFRASLTPVKVVDQWRRRLDE